MTANRLPFFHQHFRLLLKVFSRIENSHHCDNYQIDLSRYPDGLNLITLIKFSSSTNLSDYNEYFISLRANKKFITGRNTDYS